ncbi:IS6 family transposase [Belnapia sp. F-4-1]|uniref:IS6 family transposase n=1 Tax=Belnapia sp. F-4-1 TaxID=1545443 RepID=UPI0035100AF8
MPGPHPWSVEPHYGAQPRQSQLGVGWAWRSSLFATLNQSAVVLGIPSESRSPRLGIRDWEAKLAPALADELCGRRHGRRGTRGRRWHVDETYLKVRGRWCYLYRAVDCDGNLVDTMLSEHRDIAAAQAFFRSATAATGVTPDQVTTDGHGSYPRAIRSTLGQRVVHRTSAYKNNRPEQDHRGVKGRIRCMRGFKSFASAERFCRSHDELRNFLPPPHPPQPARPRACSTSVAPPLRSLFSRRHRANAPCISRRQAWREC